MSDKISVQREKSRLIHEELKKLYPGAVCSLNYNDDPWRLLVMARLSAQCTDERVNIVSVPLFEKYPTVYEMAVAEFNDVCEIVRPCGLHNSKAKSIIEMSVSIVNDFDGKVPDDIDSLLTLSGVGRKIANLVLGDVFSKPAIVPDTHCIRLNGRFGFYDESLKNPEKVEKILNEIIEKSEQSNYCHRMVLFGRDYCMARGPRCDVCPVSKYCKHYELINQAVNKTAEE